MKTINLPIDEAEIKNLKAGEVVMLRGEMLTARDAAHKRLTDMIKDGEPLPFDISGECIYYAGPCPAAPGKASGSCGPTTSSRVDEYTPLLLSLGLKAMVGKGERSVAVREAAVKYGAVYFAAIGGCGALYGNCIEKSEVLAFPELLSEAVHKIKVRDFPAVVAIDCAGNDIFEKGEKR